MSILEIYTMGFSEWQIRWELNPPLIFADEDSSLQISRRSLKILEHRQGLFCQPATPIGSPALQGIEMNLIMFDLDGTLIKSSTLDTRCLLGAIESSMGIRNADSDWTRYRYVTDAGIASEIVERHLNRTATKEELQRICSKLAELLQAEAENNRDKFAPLPGALDLIRTLKNVERCGYAIATGCWKKSALFKLSTAGFDAADLPLASSDDSYDREEIMAVACERAKAFYGVGRFETTTYVGDGLWDLRSSRKMGYPFIGIASGIDGALFLREGASCVLADFRDKEAFFAAMERIWKSLDAAPKQENRPLEGDGPPDRRAPG